MHIKTLFLFLLAIATEYSSAQNVGIGTENPIRTLEIMGNRSRYLRVHAYGIQSKSSLQFVRDLPASGSTDWEFLNSFSSLRLRRSLDNFQTAEEIITITSGGEVGIGTVNPVTRLHIDNGEDASNTFDGYIMLGDKTSANMVMDNNEILARNNGAPATLTLQPYGGDLNLQAGGGTTHIGSDEGNFNINNNVTNAKMNLGGNGLQLLLENNDGTTNNWYIGASADNWTAGDGQLIFSPSATTSSSILRLRNVPASDGTIAPVEIHSANNQQLLMDGEHIDSKSTGLYLNHNSQNNVILNVQGGDVGLGIANPGTRFHIHRDLETPYSTLFMNTPVSNNWEIDPLTNTGDLGIYCDGALVSRIDEDSGQWVSASDENMKTDIEPLKDVLGDLMTLEAKSYYFNNRQQQEKSIGFLAQDVVEVFPSLVKEVEGSYKMSYQQLSVIALKALQEQADQIAQLQQKLESLASKKKINN